ncbi:SNF2 family N-terminal domain-containing protein [Lipomyces tetrasporus]|uniref:SNF2 family N-terminal domain-containing protein n=1 Tax=Lipomyces tetrasporus TaxID=54092 RepID=A0AAD7QU20_9ASCO|nr:SNF2 family N-terminal domain-containing protein [Lipomyces tetrasporus]KAJ8101385.1 SNF2 family N-terminal domain-containing protein [Lipomyces tetrasporus]
MYRPFKPPSFITRSDAATPLSSAAAGQAGSSASAAAGQKRKAHQLDATADDCQIISSRDKICPEDDCTVVAVEPRKTTTTQFTPLTIDVYFTALWRKLSTKKNKTWDGDGILVLKDHVCTLQDSSGKVMGRTRAAFTTMSPGETIRVGNYEAEADAPLSDQEFLSGRMFMNPEAAHALRTHAGDNSPAVVGPSPRPQFSTTASASAGFKAPYANDAEKFSAATFYAKYNSNSASNTGPIPRHDPSAPNALVLPRPTGATVDVVVDPYVCKFLRPHQRDGVQFLYECVMGMTGIPGNGALLADEMGLGKTLMTIALVWTLLKQNPVWGRPPVANKVMIVCPVTLIGNWKREFRKWLGRERVAVFPVDGKAKLRDFTNGKVYQVMIIGYEKLRLVQSELKDVTFDLVVCDEGHRIKSANNKSALALRTLKTPRRVLLTGTPIQNDLGEFFSMIDFVNPGLFDSYTAFKKEFELPIMRSRQPDARKQDIELGRARSEELAKLTKTFVLRRTADILAKYLPPKHEFVVFCKPTRSQLDICKDLLESKVMKSLIKSDDMSNHLRAITALKKVCNSPKLLLLNASDATDSFVSTIDRTKAQTARSGKLIFLESFLQQLHDETDEKVVLVSSFTQTLDLLQSLLATLAMPFHRLDGTTPTKKRQEIVDAFNVADQTRSFAFLLSAKSGGAGINLVGASRLILFDTDWNPSVDLQAMARIHRDGQKRPVYIYRLLTTGCIDEKIFQRQLTKQGLADNLMDGKADSSENSFTMTELRDIFAIYDDTACHTHDLLECNCDGTGGTHIKQETVESGSDDVEDDGGGEGAGWVSATQVLQGQSVVPKRMQAKNRLKALLEFTHIDPRAVVGKRMACADENMGEIVEATDDE